ncbi:hypothetical protein ACFL1A_00735 [Patescibacteria group bacterium]
MIKKNKSVYLRIGTRHIVFLLKITTILVVLILAFFIYIRAKKDTIPYISIGFATDPVLIVFFNKEENSLMSISVPASTNIDVTGNSGLYKLSSVWELSLLDETKGEVFKNSLETAIGVPISYFYGFGAEIRSDSDQNNLDICTIESLYKYINKSYISDISVNDYISFCWSKMFLEESDIDEIEIIDQSYFEKIVFPDGSKGSIFNLGRIDNLLDRYLEINSLRNENLSIAFFNNTDAQGLSSRVSRIFTKIGIRVVSAQVGEESVKNCLISGNKDALESLSANIIGSMLGCGSKEVDNISGVDISVYLGDEVAKNYSIR